ncbi:MAG: leader peptidase (prepilin peptidase)/N-methyltransferase [Bermanella sp.]|jgi:leader peptidase (prepilin peptidase)/N-methyltransferase
MIETGLSAAVLATMGSVFGLLIGSFLNVVILRVPLQLKAEWRRDAREFLGLEAEPSAPLTLSRPNSRCPNCKVPIRPRHNIPLISYIFLRGRCNACAKSIAPQYPFVELISALLTAFFVHQFGLSVVTVYGLILSYTLLVLTGIDLQEKLLPDQITLPLLWIGLFANLSGTFVPLTDAVVGAIAGYLSLWIVFWIFKALTGKEGMGYGDFKLLAALGAWLGWQMLPMVILLSTTVAAAVSIAGIIFAGRSRDTTIAFGPFMAVAGWIAFIWGDKILTAYLALFSL